MLEQGASCFSTHRLDSFVHPRGSPSLQFVPTMLFSSIADSFPTTLNRLYQARDELRQRGQRVTDLVSGNVTEAGIQFPQELLMQVMREALAAARVYQPDSLGQRAAREAVSAYYHEAGVNLPAQQILLTPGTSVSYLYCFKLLAEAGDEILCPTPTYPLFETIARLCQVQLTSYPLRESRDWKVDLGYLESRLSTRTRAIVLICPHNPTGAVACWNELQELATIAARHALPIIADEVFSEFLFELDHLPRPAQTEAPLVFTLNGFSKMLALPGLKLGWLGVSGDATLVGKALRTLEMISDTFLPVNEPVQFAVPALLKAGKSFLSDYRRRIKQCRDAAVELLSECTNLAFVPPAAGFYLTAELTGFERDEEQWVVDLLRQRQVLVHPGYFYDIPGTHLVLSFVQDLELLRKGLQSLREFLMKG